MNNSQYTDSTAEYLYQKGEYINTIFWFVHEQAVYEEAWKNHWVAPRTIAFCYDTRAIMQNGNVYGVLDIDTFLRLLKQAFGDQIIVDFNNRTAQLAKAGYDKYGVIKISDAHKDILKIDNGVLDIDLSKWNPGDDVDLEAWLIRQIKNNPKLRAKPGEYGVVKAGSGISVDDNGVISVNNGGLPIASYTLLGLVQIALEGGIVVDNNGVISVDWSKNPGGGNGNDGGNGSDGGDGTGDRSDDNITPLLFEGTKIATFKINGTTGSLYAPNGGGGNTIIDGDDIVSTKTYVDNSVSNLVTRIDNITKFDQSEWSDQELNYLVTRLIGILNGYLWQSVFAGEGWTEAFDAYMRRIGLIVQQTGPGGVLTTVTLSDVIQTLNSFTSIVDNIQLINEAEGGAVISIRDLQSMIDSRVSANDAVYALKNLLLAWNGGGTINSALSTFISKVSDADDKMEAYNALYSGIVKENVYTQSWIKMLADETHSQANLLTSYGVYDGYEKYEGTSDDVYEVDENNHAIPYTGVMLQAKKTDGTWTFNHASDGPYEYAKDTNDQNILDENNLPLIVQRAVRVFYQADDNGNYIDAEHYVLESYLLEHGGMDSAHNIVWESTSSYNGVLFIQNCGRTVLAYHKKRHYDLISSAGIDVDAKVEKAVATQFANLDTSGIEASVKTAVTNDGAFIQSVANAANSQLDTDNVASNLSVADASTYYAKLKYRANKNSAWQNIELTEGEGDEAWIAANTTATSQVDFIRDGNNKIQYWQAKGSVNLNGEVSYTYGGGGNLLYINPNTGVVSETQSNGFEPMKKVKSGSTSRAALKLAADANSTSAALSTRLGGVESSIATVVKYKTNSQGLFLDKDGNVIDQTQTGWEDLRVLESDIKLSAQNVTIDAQTLNSNASTIRAIAADATVKSLETANHKIAIGAPATSGTTTISLQSDGSGYVANNNISWNSAGHVTIKDPTFTHTENGETQSDTINVTNIYADHINDALDIETRELHLLDPNYDTSENILTTGIYITTPNKVVYVYIDDLGYLRIPQSDYNVIVQQVQSPASPDPTEGE